MPALAAAGYRAVALSQRGYSAGARPDTREPANYSFDHLLTDAVRIAADCGNADRRLHLVGHDWGGSIAWGIADRYPARLASLAVLSRPHPNAFNRALAAPDGEQKRRSSHHWWFLEANAAERILAESLRWLRERLKANTVTPASISLHISVLGNVAAMEAAGRIAAEGTAEFVAAPYQFEFLPGIGHFAAEQVPGQVTALLLAHLAAHPA